MAKVSNAPKRDLYNEVTEAVLDQLQKGVVPWVKPWRTSGTSTNIPRNLVSKKNYRGGNVMMLWLSATANDYLTGNWLTYKQCQALGGNVRKGSKGTTVYYYRFIEKDDGTKFPLMRTYSVFNAAQCENLPVEEEIKTETVNANVRNEAVEAFIAKTKADVRFGGDRAFYRPSDDFVQMPLFESFDTSDDFYSTEFHELGHWTGHKNREDRQIGNFFGSNECAYEELVAEMTSAFLCAQHSINGTVRHADYIGNWIEVLNKDTSIFMKAASAAQKAADFINGVKKEKEDETE